jgi:hypothetical protein
MLHTSDSRCVETSRGPVGKGDQACQRSYRHQYVLSLPPAAVTHLFVSAGFQDRGRSLARVVPWTPIAATGFQFSYIFFGRSNSDPSTTYGSTIRTTDSCLWSPTRLELCTPRYCASSTTSQARDLGHGPGTGSGLSPRLRPPTYPRHVSGPSPLVRIPYAAFSAVSRPQLLDRQQLSNAIKDLKGNALSRSIILLVARFIVL